MVGLLKKIPTASRLSLIIPSSFEKYRRQGLRPRTPLGSSSAIQNSKFKIHHSKSIIPISRFTPASAGYRLRTGSSLRCLLLLGD
jgi:hypothetical protein